MTIHDPGGIPLTNYVCEKTQGNGIKVDKISPTFPWRDMLGEIFVKGVGANDPGWALYRDGINAYQFSANDEAWINFHMPHDYLTGSDLHIHFHWSHIGTLVTGGTTTWGAEVLYSKGHNQAAFGASVTSTIQDDASATQYQHIITEVQLSADSPSASQIDNVLIEPDGLLLVRAYLSSNDITVSGGGVPDPFLHYTDIHYQSTNIGTKNKAPDFYV
jgi:hypothetical protein